MSTQSAAPRRTSSLSWGRVSRATWRHPSFPAFVGLVIIWVATFLWAGRGAWGTLEAGVLAATFLVIVGIGQLFVISVGNGGIDLSVPYSMTLAAYVSCQVMNGSDAHTLVGILAGLGVGAGAGAINAILIEGVGMPPLVGTLALGFGLETVILIYSGSVLGVAAPGLQTFTSENIGPFPELALVVIGIALFFAALLKLTSYGRRIEAVGQSPTAARLSGARPKLVRASAYIVCGFLAGLGGVLLAAYSGGPSIDLGTPYQLESIAVVVLGGSLIAGGRALVGGVWAGAALLTLLGTFVNVTHLNAGLQDVIEGLLIVIVLAFSQNSEAPR
jgi:ribose transport system permease protein